jgi:hypothetical protein
MMSMTLKQPAIRVRIFDFCKSLMSRRGVAAPSEDPQEDAGARRDFVLEMMNRNPDAFRSEMDVQHMARLYRSKF